MLSLVILARLSMPDKGDLGLYKKRMYSPLLSGDRGLRLTFLRYALGDSFILYQIWKRRIDLHNSLCASCLGFPNKYLFKSFDFPSTIGRLVADTFEKYIYTQVEKEVELSRFKWALCKVGFLNPRVKEHEKSVLNRIELLQSKGEISSVLAEKHCTNYNYSYNALNMSSIPFLLNNTSQNFSYTLASVTGGRCNNERPELFHATGVLDVDIESCYGTSLSKLYYPLCRFKKAKISCENIKAFALRSKARTCCIADKRTNLKVTSVQTKEL